MKKRIKIIISDLKILSIVLPIAFVIAITLTRLTRTCDAWTYDYKITTPAGSDSPTIIDDRIREAKAATQERENVDHYWPLSTSDVCDVNVGEHRKITFNSQITKPTAIANKSFLYIKDVNSLAELFWEDESANELQLTVGGKFDVNSVQYAARTDVNQTISGIYTFSQVPVGPDSNCTAASQFARKAYVDAQDVNVIGFTPAIYTGGESVTFPNGLIMKMGYITGGASPRNVTFGTAFPHNLINVMVSLKNSSASLNTPTITSPSATGFSILIGDTGMTGYYWTATGY